MARIPREECAYVRYLVEALGFDAQYVGADRSDGRTHAWVTVNGIIVDITADQFDEEPVIVTRQSAWHDQWNSEAPRPPICSAKEWLAYPFATWNTIVEGMKARGFPVPSSM